MGSSSCNERNWVGACLVFRYCLENICWVWNLLIWQNFGLYRIKIFRFTTLQNFPNKLNSTYLSFTGAFKYYLFVGWSVKSFPPVFVCKATNLSLQSACYECFQRFSQSVEIIQCSKKTTRTSMFCGKISVMLKCNSGKTDLMMGYVKSNSWSLRSSLWSC